MVKLRIALFAICLCGGSLLLAGTDAKVTGSLVLDGQTYQLSHVQATTEENAFDKTKKDVVISLTDQAVAENDPGALYGDAREGKLHGVVLKINDEKVVYWMMVLGVSQLSGTHICDFVPTKFEKDFISGTVSKEESESFDHKYQFHATFETPVRDTVVPAVSEATGTPLPAGGGEPGKAYMEFDKAISSGDVTAIKKFAPSEEEAKMLDGPEAKQMLEFMKAMRASGIKITKGFQDGDRATLFVEGKDPMGGGQATGTIRMKKVNNQWRVEKEEWKQ